MATNRSWQRSGLAALAALGLAACSSSSATPRTTPAPQGPQGGQTGAAGRSTTSTGPKPYKDVVTGKAVTRSGIFKTHRIDDKLLFEIPRTEFGSEMQMIARAVESTMQDPGGFFGGGTQRLVRWEREGNHVVLRERRYRLQVDSTDNIYRQVRGFQNGPVISRFEIQAWSPGDSNAVIDVTDLFLTYRQEMGAVQGTVKDRSWFEHVAVFPRNIEVEATQTGSRRCSTDHPGSAAERTAALVVPQAAGPADDAALRRQPGGIHLHLVLRLLLA